MQKFPSALNTVPDVSSSTQKQGNAGTWISSAHEKSRVPDTFQLDAILPFSAFVAPRKINNLRVFNNSEYSDSPRLHHSINSS
jgi:hypothetical protein